LTEKIIFSDYGIDIFERNGKKYIRYDAGELVVQMREIQITEEEAVKAQISAKDAYNVIIACENRK
jgi:propanediol utilization protein